MRFCGVAPAAGLLQLCALREVRLPEPPIRLDATFYEPGEPERVVAQLRLLGEVVVAIAAPVTTSSNGRPDRACDRELARRGVAPVAPFEPARRLFEQLSDLTAFAPAHGEPIGPAPTAGVVFETNVDGVFASLQGRRLPARRHPLGIVRRIEELTGDHVVDEGGELWHRRIEEIEAAAAALAAHRYGVGHASWLGEPDEGVIVLPGARTPASFSSAGVMPPVQRAPLPGG